MDYEKAVEQVRKTRLLSGKNRAAVWEWAEANESNPLAVAYMGACCALGNLDCSMIADMLKETWRGRKFGYLGEAYKPYDLAFIYRDTIGRMILDMMRREQANYSSAP